MIPGQDTEAEEPLDPAAERLRAKLTKLLLASFGVMALGLFAVFAGILYKINAPEPTPATTPLDVALGQGSTIVATALSGDRLAITIRRADGPGEVVLIDAKNGRVLARYHP